MDTTPRTLSSAQTFFMKVIFPPIWIGGSRVVFMPKVRWFAFLSSHPVVEEIRAAVRRATGQAPDGIAA